MDCNALLGSTTCYSIYGSSGVVVQIGFIDLRYAEHERKPEASFATIDRPFISISAHSNKKRYNKKMRPFCAHFTRNLLA